MELLNQTIVENKYVDMQGGEGTAKYDVYTVATDAGLADKIAKDAQSTYKMAGFRNGKIPRHVMEQKIGINNLYGHYLIPVWNEFCVQNKIVTGYRTVLDNIKVRLDGSIVFEVTTIILPTVSLDIKESYKVDVAQDVTQMVARVLHSKRQSLEKAIPLTADMPSMWGNLINVDFEGFVGGANDSDLNGKNVEFKIGSRMIALPGFEEQCVGLKAGDTKKFSLSVPENFAQIMRTNPRAKYLAGKIVEFNIRANRVFEVVLPTDDELVQSEGLSSFEELYEKVLEENIQSLKNNEKKTPLRLVDLLVTDNEQAIEASIQKPVIDFKIANFLDEHKQQLDSLPEEERNHTIDRIAPNLQKALWQDVVYASLLKMSVIETPTKEEMLEEAKQVAAGRQMAGMKSVDAETILEQEWYSLYKIVQRRKVMALYAQKVEFYIDKDSDAYKNALRAVKQISVQPLEEVIEGTTQEKTSELTEQK